MLEPSTIQQRGFRNVTENGTVTGFQLAVRSKYYRGVWLPQLRPATVTVDGETFSGDQISWTVSGRTVRQSALEKHGDIHWGSMDPAVLTVSKAGGLKPGIHDVDVAFQYSASYLPPRIDLRPLGNEPRRMVLVR